MTIFVWLSNANNTFSVILEPENLLCKQPFRHIRHC